MSKVYIGVDPGMSGAIATLHPEASGVAYDKIPTKEVNGKHRLNYPALLNLLMVARDLVRGGIVGTTEALVVLELVHAMPRDAKSAAFSFGQSLGAIRMAVVAAGLPYTEVTPQVWKKALLLPHERDAGKGGSIVAVERLFPEFDLPRNPRGSANHNACDALLLAEWGRRNNL